MALKKLSSLISESKSKKSKDKKKQLSDDLNVSQDNIHDSENTQGTETIERVERSE